VVEGAVALHREAGATPGCEPHAAQGRPGRLLKQCGLVNTMYWFHLSMLSKAFDIQRLRVLVEVARQGSVSRAAEELRLSQPTVSLHLKALSSMLGVPVVERAGRGIRLTEAGEELEAHAALALAALDRARAA